MQRDPRITGPSLLMPRRMSNRATTQAAIIPFSEI
jgi:hypothetical protein